MKINQLRELRLQEAQQAALLHNGRLLSSNYINAHTPLEWECKNGHIWQAPYHSIRRGRWCSVCYHYSKRLSYNNVKQYIEKDGLTLLSTEYINANQKLEIRCHKGHICKVRASSLLHGRLGCPACSDTKPALEVLHKWAENKGGKLVSTNYKNKKSKLIWECAVGHQWSACWGNIYHSGSWCPTCSENIGAKICRAYFEQLFNLPFPKVRPMWLRNSDNNLLELDGYCEDLKLAFEHQGRHHYQADYYSKPGDFERRIKLDQEKVALCNKNGVTLLSVPEIFHITPVNKLKQFIIDNLPQTFIPLVDQVKEINLSKVYSSRALEQITKAKDYAKSRGGFCLSEIESYKTNKSKLIWQCNKGHKWTAEYAILDSKHWCPECNKERLKKKKNNNI